MNDPLAQFLEVASDLYATDKGYRSEIDAEAKGEQAVQDRAPSTVDRLDEIEWLIRNGMRPQDAATQVGWHIDDARKIARRWSHKVQSRIDPEEGPASGAWAKRWLAGQVAA